MHWRADSLPLRSCFRILAIVKNAAIQVAQLVKNPPAIQDTPGLIPGSGRSPGGRHGNPLLNSCVENPHGQKSLAGKSSWGHKESDMSEPVSTGHQHREHVCFLISIFTKQIREGPGVVPVHRWTHLGGGGRRLWCPGVVGASAISQVGGAVS